MQIPSGPPSRNSVIVNEGRPSHTQSDNFTSASSMEFGYNEKMLRYDADFAQYLMLIQITVPKSKWSDSEPAKPLYSRLKSDSMSQDEGGQSNDFMSNIMGVQEYKNTHANLEAMWSSTADQAAMTVDPEMLQYYAQINPKLSNLALNQQFSLVGGSGGSMNNNASASGTETRESRVHIDPEVS